METQASASASASASATTREELRARVRTLRGELTAQRQRLDHLLEKCMATARQARTGPADPNDGPRLFTRDVVRVGDASIVVARQEVRHSGGTQRLTPTEWQLLAYLLANPSVVHSRVALATGAWGQGFADRNSEVEVYISRLRRKLGPAGVQLETVRGQGYRLLLQAPRPRLVAVHAEGMAAADAEAGAPDTAPATA